MICCVRRATRTDFSVGSHSASSMLLVCSDCVPPSTAASACSVTRTTLFSGCWAVSVEPPVWVWKRSIQERGLLGAEALPHDLRPHAAGGAELGDLLQEVVVGVEEEGKLAGKVVHIQPGVDGRLHVGDGVGQGEGHFLHRGRAGLADVVAGDADRVPVRALRAWQ